MLGHKSASLTLDTYADLFPDDLDAVANFLDTARLTSLNQEQSPQIVGTPPDRAGPRSATPPLTSTNNSGDEENRTLNPRLAKAVLCQLSYVPRPHPGGRTTTEARNLSDPSSRRAGQVKSPTEHRDVRVPIGPGVLLGAGGFVPKGGLGGSGVATLLDQGERTASECKQHKKLLHECRPSSLYRINNSGPGRT